MGVTIQLAQSQRERHAAFRFRYQVLVSELKRACAFACHLQVQVRDPLDDTARVLVARQGTEIVGTLRINFLRDGTIAHLEPILGLPQHLITDPSNTSVTSRAAVLGSERRGTVFARLARAVYSYALHHGIITDWIVGRPELIGMYQRMGYHPVGEPTRHPEVGTVQPLRLDLTDCTHLASVRSPFVPVLAEFSQSSDSTQKETATWYPQNAPLQSVPTS